MSDWHDQLKKVIFQAGLDDKSTVFIISDNQITKEAFLEDINNLINIGEVPNLMEVEDN